jgi:hypothetical protein
VIPAPCSSLGTRSSPTASHVSTPSPSRGTPKSHTRDTPPRHHAARAPRPSISPSPLEHSVVLRALGPWPCLNTDDRRALRVCCTTMRQAVDSAPLLQDAMHA